MRVVKRLGARQMASARPCHAQRAQIGGCISWQSVEAHLYGLLDLTVGVRWRGPRHAHVAAMDAIRIQRLRDMPNVIPSGNAQARLPVTSMRQRHVIVAAVIVTATPDQRTRVRDIVTESQVIESSTVAQSGDVWVDLSAHEQG